MRAFILRSFTFSRLLLAIAAFATAALGAALIGQYGFDLHPCHLCLLQRVPYGIIIPVGLIGGLFIKDERAHRGLAVFCILLLFADSAIAAYHAGVEAGIIPGPSGCSSSGKTNQTLEEMRAEIMNAPMVTCDQAMIHVLGLSMAAWNALGALGAGLASTYIACTLRKKP